jgi:hypothetical protein
MQKYNNCVLSPFNKNKKIVQFVQYKGGSFSITHLELSDLGIVWLILYSGLRET